MQLRQQATILAAATILLSNVSAWAEERTATSPLDGRWKVVSAKSNGSGNYMSDVRDKMIVRVEKGTIRFMIDGTDSEQAAKFVLRPEKNPAEIDTREVKDHKWNNDNNVTKLFRAYKIVEQKAVPADDKGEGIYKLEGDKLTLCWRTIPGHEQKADGKVSADSYLRPTNFRSDLYNHQFLFVLERIP